MSLRVRKTNNRNYAVFTFSECVKVLASKIYMLHIHSISRMYVITKSHPWFQLVQQYLNLSSTTVRVNPHLYNFITYPNYFTKLLFLHSNKTVPTFYLHYIPCRRIVHSSNLFLLFTALNLFAFVIFYIFVLWYFLFLVTLTKDVPRFLPIHCQTARTSCSLIIV